MASDVDVFFDADDFAESVTYNPTGGESSTIIVLLERDDPLQETYVRGSETAHALLYVKTSEVSTPQHGDTFAIGTETWELDPEEGVVEIDDNIALLSIRRVD